MRVNEKRIYALNDIANIGNPESCGGPVLYWMSREHRVQDNWGLIHARMLAGDSRPLVVVFVMSPSFMCATFRQCDFMLKGLEAVSEDLSQLGIPFVLRVGSPAAELVKFATEIGASVVVTDFNPLKMEQSWQRAAASELSIPLMEVDGRNIVPARFVSDKHEYSARTIRPKIHRLLFEFLEEFPKISPLNISPPDVGSTDWNSAYRAINVDRSVMPVETESGEVAAHIALEFFIKNKLKDYAEKRNDPNADATSHLSAYFNFGQLGPQRAALDVYGTGGGESQDAFLEELIVRRELSENFCLYNPDYASLNGAPNWAIKTLDEHRDDPRQYLYNREEFEQGRTHSLLWNAAQSQMRRTGYMHGYMRMYWAKKILEWSPTPEDALKTAIVLNDRYQLDGRSPNGYVGALWSIAGLHDRAWKRRPVYGTVRYMNERGCRRKFNVDEYISRWS